MDSEAEDNRAKLLDQLACMTWKFFNFAVYEGVKR
jgi:hypothetical protein